MILKLLSKLINQYSQGISVVKNYFTTRYLLAYRVFTEDVMNVNQFFDFGSAWVEIVSGYKTDDKFNTESLETIESYSIREHITNPYFTINKEECEVYSGQIVFVFDEGKELSEDSVWITIIYDTDKDDFISCQC